MSSAGAAVHSSSAAVATAAAPCSAKKSSRGKNHNRLMVKYYIANMVDFVKQRKQRPNEREKLTLLHQSMQRSMEEDPREKQGSHRSDVTVRAADLFVSNLKKAAAKQKASGAVDLHHPRQRHVHECAALIDQLHSLESSLPRRKRAKAVKRRRTQESDARVGQRSDSDAENPESQGGSFAGGSGSETQSDQEDIRPVDDRADYSEEEGNPQTPSMDDDPEDGTEGEQHDDDKVMEMEHEDAEEEEDDDDDDEEELEIATPVKAMPHKPAETSEKTAYSGRGQRLNHVLITTILEQLLEFMQSHQRKPSNDEVQQIMQYAFEYAKQQDPEGKKGKHRLQAPDPKSITALRRNLKAASLKLLQEQVDGSKSKDPSQLKERQQYVLRCGNLVAAIEQLEASLGYSSGKVGTGEMILVEGGSGAAGSSGMMSVEPSPKTRVDSKRGVKRKASSGAADADTESEAATMPRTPHKGKSGFKRVLQASMEASEARGAEMLALMQQQLEMQRQMLEMQRERFEAMQRHDDKMLQATVALCEAVTERLTQTHMSLQQ